MADISETNTFTPAPSRLNRAGAILSAPFRAVFRGMIAMAESSDSLRQVERLNAMSDAQLAARGMRREDIVRVVFAGYL